jgi:DNA polymerase delta subunit 1
LYLAGNMSPTKRARFLFEEGGGAQQQQQQQQQGEQNQEKVSIVSSSTTLVSPKRLRGGGSGSGAPFNNPYTNAKKKSSSSSAGGSRPAEARQPAAAARRRPPADDDDEDDVDKHYEDADDFMDEIQEIPDDAEDISHDNTVFSDITENMRQRWVRPPCQIYDNSNDLSLQCFDMDLLGGPALEQNPNELKEDRRAVGSKKGQVPIIRAYGVTEVGNSVTVFIHGYTPYGFFALPEHAKFDDTTENRRKIREYLNQRLEGQARGAGKQLEEYCVAVRFFDDKKSIMGYKSPHTQFFRIMVTMPTLIPTLKRIMEEGIELPGVKLANQDNQYSAFECNVPFVLRYMIDQDIGGAGWLTLPAKTYQVREQAKKQTHCQVC